MRNCYTVSCSVSALSNGRSSLLVRLTPEPISLADCAGAQYPTRTPGLKPNFETDCERAQWKRTQLQTPQQDGHCLFRFDLLLNANCAAPQAAGASWCWRPSVDLSCLQALKTCIASASTFIHVMQRSEGRPTAASMPGSVPCIRLASDGSCC